MACQAAGIYSHVVSPIRSRASYHHGSLRETLISACLELIRAEGIGAVSLRRVAREAGVSPGAPYHHFADRSALLTAICVEGFRLLESRLTEARAGAASPDAALTALMKAYVRFAHEQPAYFHLMFRPELVRPDEHPDAKSAGKWAFRVLREVVEECQLAGTVPPGPAAPLIGTVWALGHGLASLWVDGPLQDRSKDLGESPEALIDQVATGMRAILAGATRAGVQLGT